MEPGGRGLNMLGQLSWEDHKLLTAKSTKCYSDSGCFGEASSKNDQDVAIRDAINVGEIPGSRYLANGMVIVSSDGDLVAGTRAYADGLDKMREIVKKHIRLGVDQIKLSMSGEGVNPPLLPIIPQTNGNYEITEIRSAQDCYFFDEEIAACVEEACSLEQQYYMNTQTHSIDILYYTSYIDEEGMNILEANKMNILLQP
ncbi:hypothetical protein BTUL_0036g00480 [Botrytis tulipae]|uniref:Uncharacterized protein n=1 Tax=Botrytis tulipae TaxID=87230 RepID=A0A4Z1F3S1_9HELO|nr:hypothetical protein BTUL_0036g00480 [Botrytis tulipae]